MTSPVNPNEVYINFEDYTTTFNPQEQKLKLKKVKSVPHNPANIFFTTTTADAPESEKPKTAFLVAFYYKEKDRVLPEYGSELHLEKEYAKSRFAQFVDYYKTNNKVECIYVGLKFINFNLNSIVNVCDEEEKPIFFSAKRETKEKVYLNGPKKNLNKLGKHYANANSK